MDDSNVPETFIVSPHKAKAEATLVKDTARKMKPTIEANLSKLNPEERKAATNFKEFDWLNLAGIQVETIEENDPNLHKLLIQVADAKNGISGAMSGQNPDQLIQSFNYQKSEISKDFPNLPAAGQAGMAINELSNRPEHSDKQLDVWGSLFAFSLATNRLRDYTNSHSG
jgi:hypothetical protein